MMTNLFQLFLILALCLSLGACGSQGKKVDDNQTRSELNAAPERPSDADLMAFKVYYCCRTSQRRRFASL